MGKEGLKMKHDPNRDVKLLLDYSAEIGKPPHLYGSEEIMELWRRITFSERFETEAEVGEVWKGE